MSQLQPRLSHPNYRPDIDGLRAIAVLSVVVFHAFPDWIRGGFIGVDIFFVISGFLISTIIFENLDRGTFSFSEFYARRIKRIFPALLLVLLASYAFGWFALLADEYKQLGKHIAAGAGFVSNIMLWHEAGYFDNLADTKPLLHLWSLGVEEQFYIAWPLLIWFSFRQKFNLLAIVVLVVSASFCLNMIEIKTDTVATFYSPQTRFWELGCGGLLAWERLYKKGYLIDVTKKVLNVILWKPGWKKYQPDSKGCENLLSLLGLMLLSYGFWKINRGVNFPGGWAIFPVLGAVLIIMAGPAAWINSRLMGSRIAVGIGLISFPLYLWHWPLLSFARIMESEVPSFNIRLGAVVLSFVLAWLTYRFVERPLRSGIFNMHLVAWLGIFMAAVAYMGYNTYARDGYDFRGEIGNFKNNKNELVRTPAQDPACLEYVGKKMPLFPYCRLTKVGDKETVAVVGDSHAHVAYPGISDYLKKRGINSVLLANSSCPPLLDVPIIVGKSDAEKLACQNRIDELVAVLLSHKDIKRIFFITRGPVYFTGTEPLLGDSDMMSGGAVSLSAYKAGTQRTIDRLLAAGKSIFYVTENPELERTPEACIARPLRLHAKNCSVDKLAVKLRQESYLSMARSLRGITLIENVDAFCPTDSCLVFDSKGALLYADDNHLSVAGSRFQVANNLIKFLN